MSIALGCRQGYLLFHYRTLFYCVTPSSSSGQAENLLVNLTKQILHQFALVRCVAILIDHKDVGLDGAQLRFEVEVTTTAGDQSLVHATHVLHYEATLPLKTLRCWRVGGP